MATNMLDLVVGDYSNDGHGKSERIVVRCNRTAKQLAAAYRRGSKKVGVDIVANCCTDFECSTIPDATIEKLKKAKIRSAEYFAEDADFKDADAWVELYLDICKIGDSKIKAKIIPEDYKRRLNIGGYGLFYG